MWLRIIQGIVTIGLLCSLPILALIISGKVRYSARKAAEKAKQELMARKNRFA